MNDRLARARALHASAPLVDGHNDYPWALRDRSPGRDLAALDITRSQPNIHTDLPRLRAGGVGMQFWAAYVAPGYAGAEAAQIALEQIDVVHRMVARWPEHLTLARTVDEAAGAFAGGRIASMIGVEGGHAIADSLAVLRTFYDLGARYLTLTHNLNVSWADSGTDAPRAHGLTPFGVEVVREMNRLGMLVDLSHTSPDTMRHALRISQAPILFSHTAARALNDHGRNVPDDVLRATAENGGVVMVTFVPGFISPVVRIHEAKIDGERARLRALHPDDETMVKSGVAAWKAANLAPRATVSQVADHIDHIRSVAGIDHIGIGGDFDGITVVVEGLEDVSTYPNLTAELLRRGYSDDDVTKVIGGNVLRVWQRAEDVAARLRQERGPSTATIEALDEGILES